MRIEPFEMERWQSTWEHKVAYNLSESGVHPLSVEELLELPGADGGLVPAALLDLRLGYTQGNGAEALRERIALLYPGADLENVLVTHGGAEANFLTTLRLLEPGDEVVMMLPNYMQTHGLVRGWGATVRGWPLRRELEWRPDPDELARLVNPKTRLIIITNPNNPTGRVLGEAFLDAVARAADRVGAWVLSDEIYRGAERDGQETPSMWGRCERLVITSGLSKAYGLPGLRIGWAASPDREMVHALWTYHDYSTICLSPITETLAIHALEPERRRRILERTRAILNRNLPLLLEWVDAQAGLFDYVPPDAGAILWVKYALEVNSSELAERARADESTLIVPGDQFGMDHYLRLGYGPEPDYLVEGLTRLRRVLERLGA
jgi:aspartate/methionine/tyrosine aminotransferase